MKNIIYSIIVLSIVMTACVSQKKYAELRKMYNEEVLNCTKEKALLNADISTRIKFFREVVTYNRELETEKELLERELEKHIRTENRLFFDSTKYLVDSAGVYTTFYAVEKAHSATEALVAAHSTIRDSIISVCQSIQLETIDRYIQSVNTEYDSATIYTNPNWQEAMQYSYSDLWVDDAGTYWAVEVQRMYWIKFAEDYVAKTVDSELIIERLEAFIKKQFEDKDSNEYQGNRLYFKDDKVRPKFKQDLFRDILNAVLDEKIK